MSTQETEISTQEIIITPEAAGNRFGTFVGKIKFRILTLADRNTERRMLRIIVLACL